MRATRFLLAALLAALLATATPAAAIDLQLNPVAQGLSQPIFVTHAGDGSDRLFIAEQFGKIRILRDGQLLADAFLDIGPLLSGDSEQGLLGLAFDPDFASSGRFYVYYTNISGGSVLSRFTVSSTDADRADPGSERQLLAFSQPFANHNGGWIGFGPDGFLYLASGDGGSGGDPQGNGQNLSTLLGKMLRLDVSGELAAAPADNPFRNTAGALPEIWAYGLRNPWRASFDRDSGALWIADVGQRTREEVNRQAPGVGGNNYGWRVLEGSECFNGTSCSNAGTVLPVAEYGRSEGCSVTGGYVYRGTDYPGLRGIYLFGDFCSGRVFGLREQGSDDSSFVRETLAETGLPISSFGEDERGNVYLASYNGTVYLLSDGDVQAGPDIDGRFTGTWFDPAQSGHGLFVEVLPDNLLVAYWFTFDSEGRQAWFGGAGTIEGNEVRMDAVRAEGGRFIPDFNPQALSYPVIGQLTLRFESCRRGRIEFDLGTGFGTGSMALERLTEPLGTACNDDARAKAARRVGDD